MHLSLAQLLPFEPRQAWPLLTLPDQMNRWSTAHIEGLAPGDAGRWDTVGTYRRVSFRPAGVGPRVRLPEVIQHADSQRALVYRVVDAPQVRFHRGRIGLTPVAGGTRLTWDVTLDLVAPAAERLLRPLLAKQLRDSLTALARTTPCADAPALPPLPTPDEPDVTPLWRAAHEVHAAQGALADALARDDDPKRWFARAYVFVTERQLAHVARSGDVEHVSWVLRIIPRFHTYYVRNLQAWMRGDVQAVEWHWRRAFREMERQGKRRRDRRLALFLGLMAGIAAHIEEDLPRALAEVYADHYAGRCDYARFRADYLLMGDIFRGASEQLIAEMPPSLVPLWARGAQRTLPTELVDALRNRRFYDVPRRRLAAFERGCGLAALLTQRAGPRAA